MCAMASGAEAASEARVWDGVTTAKKDLTRRRVLDALGLRQSSESPNTCIAVDQNGFDIIESNAKSKGGPLQGGGSGDGGAATPWSVSGSEVIADIDVEGFLVLVVSTRSERLCELPGTGERIVPADPHFR